MLRLIYVQRIQMQKEVEDVNIDQWITLIFEAAIEGSEDVVTPSDKVEVSC